MFTEYSENTVYQYYTIVSDSDEIKTENIDLENQHLTYLQDDEEDGTKKQVMYLTFGQSEEELLPQEPEPSTSEEPDTSVIESDGSNIKLITFGDGQIYVSNSGVSGWYN